MKGIKIRKIMRELIIQEHIFGHTSDNFCLNMALQNNVQLYWNIGMLECWNIGILEYWVIQRFIARSFHYSKELFGIRYMLKVIRQLSRKSFALCSPLFALHTASHSSLFPIFHYSIIPFLQITYVIMTIFSYLVLFL